MSGGSSAKAQAGGSGFAHTDTDVNQISYKRVYTDNTGAIGKQGTKPAMSYFPDPVTATAYDFKDIFVGVNSTFNINGTNLKVDVRELSCDKTGLIVVPDYTILTVDKGKSESVVSCSFDLKTEGEIRMPSTVTLTGPNNNFAGKDDGVLL